MVKKDDFESKTLTTLPIRRKAPATIRSICSHRLSETEYLVITAGGQQSIPAWKVSLATDDEGQVLLTCSDIGPRRTLLKSETDCRIMAIACLPVDGHQKGLFHVFTANSDAYLRVLEFNIQTGAFQLLAQSDAQDCCLQCLRVVRLEDKDWIITGGTSGRISLWTFESLLTLKQDFAIHQSGINSLDAQMNKESGELAVVSGGDDNLVSWLSLCMNHKEDEWMETGRVSISTAHASTITGVSLLNFETFASVSIDQRVHLWQVSRSMTGSTQNARLELLQSRYTHIADVQCMDVLQRYVVQPCPHPMLSLIFCVKTDMAMPLSYLVPEHKYLNYPHKIPIHRLHCCTKEHV